MATDANKILKLNVKNRNVCMAYCKLKWFFTRVSFPEAAIGGVLKEHFIKKKNSGTGVVLWNFVKFLRTPFL